MDKKFDGWPHVIESQQFSREWLEQYFFPFSRRMENIFKHGGSEILRKKRMISFFYERSTRTRLSFQMAMSILGGEVPFTTEDARKFSSVSKGESFVHTIRMLNIYCPDVIVLRCDNEGGAKIASEISNVPIINAGDGQGQHPTQALLDIFTIQKRFGRIDGLSIAMVGDLIYGRTVRSLSYLLGKFSNIRIYFISPKQARIKKDIKDYLDRHNIWFQEGDDLRKVAPIIDVCYQTRTQKERGGVINRNDEKQGFFIIDNDVADSMQEGAIIMHPLPIDEKDQEIRPEVENNPRAVYLTDQVKSGLFTRMAILSMLLADA
ncbi:MAG: aspartate carbamoyltransferase [Candidatus Nealsonbacteria bacterium]